MMASSSKVATFPASASYYIGDDLLTDEDLMAWLKVKKSWIYERTRERARVREKPPMPYTMAGGLRRYSRMKIAEWLAGNSA
jgi:predicted DNA-binding transcriptional regulator AlpA